jgi:hypothetical protein
MRGMDTRTGAWLIVRLELAVGFSATAAPFAWFVLPAPVTELGGNGLDPWVAALTIAGVAGSILGLAWMWCIFRASPESGAPPWRYRDR